MPHTATSIESQTTKRPVENALMESWFGPQTSITFLMSPLPEHLAFPATRETKCFPFEVWRDAIVDAAIKPGLPTAKEKARFTVWC